MLITRLGLLGIKLVISIKFSGVITPSEKLLGKRRNLFSPDILSCYKLTKVHNLPFSIQFDTFTINLGMIFLLGRRIVTPSPDTPAVGPETPDETVGRI